MLDEYQLPAELIVKFFKKIAFLPDRSCVINLDKWYKYSAGKFSGKLNPRWKLGHRLGLAYAFTDKFKISGLFGYVYKWTYESSRFDDEFYFQQSLSYAFTPDFKLSFGHLSEGRANAPNGGESNLNVFDSNESQFFTTISTEF